MYDTFYNETSVIFVYRTMEEHYYKGYNKLEVLIPIGTLVAFDPENSKMYYGNDVVPFTNIEFIDATRNMSYDSLLEKTKEEYFDMYHKELSKKFESQDEIINYGDVSIRDGSICSNLINKGIKFNIKRMD